MLPDDRFLKIKMSAGGMAVMLTMVHVWPQGRTAFYKTAAIPLSRFEECADDPRYARALYAVTIDGLDEALDYEMWQEVGRGYGGRKSWVAH